ncbi:MAG: LOG family protein [Firmicutes bacterium]|nr:LOG family protein [Bacillota bacterium]
MAVEPTVITVFGSSRPRPGDADYEEARALGAALARRGFAVCTGGYGGVMEAASRGAREAGGHVLAVTAEFFRTPANRWVEQEIRVESWQQRLFELIRRGAGYVACKGGTGTLVELAVVWEMLNKGVLSPRPFVVLGHFWRPVIACVREVEAPGRPSSEVPAAPWREAGGPLIYEAATPADAADYLHRRLHAAQ